MLQAKKSKVWKAISNLALLNRDGEDRLIWKFNRHGIYMVRSTYRYAMETLVDNMEFRVPGEWLKMWSLKIPKRVKVFLWRAVRGVLPTRMRLQDKGVPCTDCCPFCETNYENDWHVFIGREEVKTVWRTADLWDLIAEIVADAASFADCFFSLLCRLTADESKDMAIILWCIWRRRNDKVRDSDLKPVSIAIQLAREALF